VVCIAITLLCAAQIACGQDRWYKASVVTAFVAQGTDIASTLGKDEANPILGRGPFGGRQVGIKLGIFSFGMTAQYVAVRKQPQHKRIATIVNFALAGVTMGVAVRNWRIRR